MTSELRCLLKTNSNHKNSTDQSSLGDLLADLGRWRTTWDWISGEPISKPERSPSCVTSRRFTRLSKPVTLRGANASLNRLS
jgi:hypothetical protein